MRIVLLAGVSDAVNEHLAAMGVVPVAFTTLAGLQPEYIDQYGEPLTDDLVLQAVHTLHGPIQHALAYRLGIHGTRGGSPPRPYVYSTRRPMDTDVDDERVGRIAHRIGALLDSAVDVVDGSALALRGRFADLRHGRRVDTSQLTPDGAYSMVEHASEWDAYAAALFQHVRRLRGAA